MYMYSCTWWGSTKISMSASFTVSTTSGHATYIGVVELVVKKKLLTASILGRRQWHGRSLLLILGQCFAVTIVSWKHANGWRAPYKSAKEEDGHSFSVSTFNHERAPESRQPDNHQPSQSSICTESWLVRLPVAAGLFTFLYFHLKTSKFIYFQREARCSEHLEWENHSAWVLSWWREFSGRPLTEFWRHILSGCQVCDWGIQYHLCSTYRGLWGLVVVRLSWLSGKTLAAQARGVLGSTSGGCRPFHCLSCSNSPELFCPTPINSIPKPSPPPPPSTIPTY